MEEQQTIKKFFEQTDVTARFKAMLGNRATSFITSVLQIVNSSDKLRTADQFSIYNAACVAATLDLPINPNFGFAYIIPYSIKKIDTKTNKPYWITLAQFQMGYKGFVQLAQRSQQFKTINVAEVKEGEVKVRDRLTGEIEFQWIANDEERAKKVTIGFVAYFRLLNGFEKMLYMTNAQMNLHGNRYSKSYANADGLWKTDFEAMGQKTVLKLLLSKYAPLSVDMQKAITLDSATILNAEGTDFTYPDNNGNSNDNDENAEVVAQWQAEIDKCKTLDDLKVLENSNKEVIEGNDFIKQLFIVAAQVFSKGKEKAKLLTQQAELMLDSKTKGKN